MRTNFNWINGDKKLSLANRFLWYLNVYIDSFFYSKKIKTKNFTKIINFPEPSFADETMSPSRIISNIFWLALPADKIKKYWAKNFIF